ncbi:hypothetical protein [Oryza sativa Japonica Group]|uniref:Uncharacterized protein n=1 Tax=Oryza sativa subsp. japonica TaxID=39947 RepID=Q5QLU4_ORYSJ|nr:hypothetical protein [Oryza sativa Japonica Group]
MWGPHVSPPSSSLTPFSLFLFPSSPSPPLPTTGELQPLPRAQTVGEPLPRGQMVGEPLPHARTAGEPLPRSRTAGEPLPTRRWPASASPAHRRPASSSPVRYCRRCRHDASAHGRLPREFLYWAASSSPSSSTPHSLRTYCLLVHLLSHTTTAAGCRRRSLSLSPHATGQREEEERKREKGEREEEEACLRAVEDGPKRVGLTRTCARVGAALGSGERRHVQRQRCTARAS